ncbi:MULTISPECIES: glycosyltransferase family 87 protein [Methylorubrum]|jgi:hypothetical protein|uniref:DUF2029 domain-containing protein n=1 Tax=Methylorubrum extorquens DSM 13060 TaxID=882800 RepID=H1KIG1_METEX|nr:glycosyltransferase family 87 protein [Methylorubrum extorquens]EHP92681.1 hypothetical protein MetexDRAFT_2423 [Methylorubrum extorquens DSM 13060]MCP1542501.1 hypothetical protein [Methylorubrum extorquens]MCP1590154.1 hypothetical protein [Methylorubrum extorquens]BDL38980.1 hypothetical protein MSPGM_15700 [Methylorubrum sp. GM97]
MRTASLPAEQSRPRPATVYERLATPLVVRTLLAALTVVILGRTARFTGLFGPIGLSDFDILHIAGRMVWRGDIADAYHLPALLRVQQDLTGQQDFLPWAYPPPFNLVVAVLATLPVSLAYLLFTGTTLAAFLFVLRRIAGPFFPALLIALFPALFITVSCGQNGFLTGTLIGLSCLGLVHGRASAGLPLGLMVIKPHLAVGVAVCALALRRWACLAVAAVTAGLAAALATAVLGPAIWPAFLRGADEASANLAAGLYPLFRMVSVYASLRSLDLPAAVALAAQVVTAVTALGLVLLALRRGVARRQVVGLAAVAGLLVSPYAYDYDLSLYGVGLALLLPDLLDRASRREQAALLGLGWVASGYGFVAGTINEHLVPVGAEPLVTLSLPGPLLLILLALMWHVLRRERAPASALQTDPAAAALQASAAL